jgi:hypothetical protein
MLAKPPTDSADYLAVGEHVIVLFFHSPETREAEARMSIRVPLIFNLIFVDHRRAPRSSVSRAPFSICQSCSMIRGPSSPMQRNLM